MELLQVRLISARGADKKSLFFLQCTSPRAQRPARPSTLRDSSRRVQHWSSVDEVAFNGSGNSPSGDDPDRRRESRHAGTAKSPLAGREGRSVVREGLRAAGLARLARKMSSLKAFRNAEHGFAVNWGADLH
jgi:hypothetical protein